MDRHRAAPHPPEAKEAPLDQAPPGMLGLETALALALGELDMPLDRIVAALSWQPARIARVDDRHGRSIAPGEPADLCVLDPALEWEVIPARLASKSRDTPYAGRTLRGEVRHTVFNGHPTVRHCFASRCDRIGVVDRAARPPGDRSVRAHQPHARLCAHTHRPSGARLARRRRDQRPRGRPCRPACRRTRAGWPGRWTPAR